MGNLKQRKIFKPGIDGQVVLECIVKKENGRLWT